MGRRIRDEERVLVHEVGIHVTLTAVHRKVATDGRRVGVRQLARPGLAGQRVTADRGPVAEDEISEQVLLDVVPVTETHPLYHLFGPAGFGGLIFSERSGSAGKRGTLVTIDTTTPLSLVGPEEYLHARLLFVAQRGIVPLRELVERRLVGYQGRLVQLDRKSPDQWRSSLP